MFEFRVTSKNNHARAGIFTTHHGDLQTLLFVSVGTQAAATAPVGAYVANPSLEGKATFGFVSKCKKGASVPSGNTEFQFHVADLNFKSISYDWLVVNQDGTNAQFKGAGAINGAGSYKFMLWAGDGSPDTFRIKIWEEDEYGVESVIYDNGTDQAIGGGSIVVHKVK